MKVLATYAIKGGVGKTSTAVNLAYLAASQGARVLVWDLDPQGAATFYFRVKPKVKGGSAALVRGKRELEDVVKGTDYENLDLVPADISYRNFDLELETAKSPQRRFNKMIRPLSDSYDFVFLDCPPSISLTSEAVFRAVDALVVPLVPTPLSLRTIDQLDAFLAEHPGRKRLQVLEFFSMVDPSRHLHRELIDDIRSDRRKMLATEIPVSADIERMGIHRAPLGSFAQSGSETAAYEKLWAEVLERL